MYLAVNRSKKCISIDLKSEEGRAIFYDLAASADIVLDSFRPGVLQKMGLDYETVKKINPKIIYVSITGYGNNGPYINKAGHDLNYIGKSRCCRVEWPITIFMNAKMADLWLWVLWNPNFGKNSV